MTKVLSTFGFCAGICLLTLAFLNPPAVGSLQAREKMASTCRMVEVPVDEGYGITQTETREVCGVGDR
jgi:hypothetical protein